MRNATLVTNDTTFYVHINTLTRYKIKTSNIIICHYNVILHNKNENKIDNLGIYLIYKMFVMNTFFTKCNF